MLLSGKVTKRALQPTCLYRFEIDVVVRERGGPPMSNFLIVLYRSLLLLLLLRYDAVLS